MNSVSTTINIDEDIVNQLNPERRCFTGIYGSTNSACEFTSKLEPKTLQVETTQPLYSNENLSFVLSFQPHTFSPQPTNWTKMDLLL